MCLWTSLGSPPIGESTPRGFFGGLHGFYGEGTAYSDPFSVYLRLVNQFLAFRGFGDAVVHFFHLCTPRFTVIWLRHPAVLWASRGRYQKVTSHSCHAVSGSCQRRRSASVMDLLPSRFSFSASLARSFVRIAGVTSAKAQLSASNFSLRIGSCFAKIESSAVFCAMLLSVMCGTVLLMKPPAMHV